jgi:hypothetical protein
MCSQTVAAPGPSIVSVKRRQSINSNMTDTVARTSTPSDEAETYYIAAIPSSAACAAGLVNDFVRYRDSYRPRTWDRRN